MRMVPNLDIDVIRERWTRFRASLGLVNTELEDFGRGGLASRVKDPAARVLVLPSDPALDVLDFNPVFWEWWAQERQNPFEGTPPTSWGRESTPTSGAAVTFERSGDSKWDEWAYFLALHRNGGLEAVLGALGAQSWGQDDKAQRVFWLTEIVGRLWAALDFYRDVIEKSELQGPWEVSVALLQTRDAQLGNVATGWKDFDGWWHGSSPRCPDSNLLIRHELEGWPDDEGVQELAFQIGGQVEDAWGITDRRFLIHADHDGAGSFDVSRYRPSR